MNNKLNDTFIYKVEYYNDTCERIIKIPVGVFSKGKQKRRFKIKNDDDNIKVEYYNSSISRSKRNIRRICLSNEFEYFATWTIASDNADRFSVTDVQLKMRNLLEEYKRHCKNFRYIYVIEKHKDGALHFHGMIKGCYLYNEKYKNFNKISEYLLTPYKKEDFEKLPLYILDSLENNKQIYYIPFFANKLGYCLFLPIKNYNACCNYIIKYITKDPVRNENDQIYFCSKGLKKCITEIYLSEFDEKFLEGSYKHTFKVFNQETLKFEEKVFCEVKDIYIDRFNKDTKIDYILKSTDKDYII